MNLSSPSLLTFVFLLPMNGVPPPKTNANSTFPSKYALHNRATQMAWPLTSPAGIISASTRRWNCGLSSLPGPVPSSVHAYA